MEVNKYYDLYMSEDINEEILNAKVSSFEDHFWHMLCLSIYYQKQNDLYLEKKCLSKACDLNYAYSAMVYFDKYEVLPSKYKQYTSEFSHAMKTDKVEERINYFNKKDKKGNLKQYFLYSLISLSIVPVMLLLVLVFHVESQAALIVAIVMMFGLQIIFNPYTRKKGLFNFKKSKNQRPLEQRLYNYLKYYDKFIPLFKNDLYIELIQAKTEEAKAKVVEKIKAEGIKNV